MNTAAHVVNGAAPESNEMLATDDPIGTGTAEVGSGSVFIHDSDGTLVGAFPRRLVPGVSEGDRYHVHGLVDRIGCAAPAG